MKDFVGVDGDRLAGTRIAGRCCSGQNRDLQTIGGDVFRVFKLRSDPPHWSFNGR